MQQNGPHPTNYQSSGFSSYPPPQTHQGPPPQTHQPPPPQSHSAPPPTYGFPPTRGAPYTPEGRSGPPRDQYEYSEGRRADSREGPSPFRGPRPEFGRGGSNDGYRGGGGGHDSYRG